ncbi:Uncharacterised protein [Candidatus Anstonella stagnisolia]|nr:Uncharacterised protein [Candidatus Anstonella stagnisolia]
MPIPVPLGAAMPFVLFIVLFEAEESHIPSPFEKVVLALLFSIVLLFALLRYIPCWKLEMLQFCTVVLYAPLKE